MIHSVQEPSHVVLGESDDHTSTASLGFEFERLSEEVAAFDEHRLDSRYREGILIQWRDVSDEWR